MVICLIDNFIILLLGINNQLIIQWIKRGAANMDSYKDITLPIGLTSKIYCVVDCSDIPGWYTNDLHAACCICLKESTLLTIRLIQDSSTDIGGFCCVIGI